ncbi:hypothetical protein Pcinc_023208 [Petrolisthes cinctipes]|uniref:Uncharacterized protein n=1 Tax=Petrolisthes cinctipes TaxID=88211 RepID=A0AAE1FCG5_PETCI|nr:hypothetical protein Pcinc_023208 [Petrolisthes cinctipes]
MGGVSKKVKQRRETIKKHYQKMLQKRIEVMRKRKNEEENESEILPDRCHQPPDVSSPASTSTTTTTSTTPSSLSSADKRKRLFDKTAVKI